MLSRLCCRHLRLRPLGYTGFRFGSSSSFLIRSPPSSAQREVPTPLVFVSAGAWDASSLTGMDSLSTLLAGKGFTSVLTDLSIPASLMKDSTDMMQAFEAELKSAVHLSMLPFPPVIIARGPACLIAQTFISSHPARGMILVSPPASNMELVQASKLPTPLEEFTFEPLFPIAVIDKPKRIKYLIKKNRLCKGDNSEVDIIAVDDLEERPPLGEIENWLDQLGI